MPRRKVKKQYRREGGTTFVMPDEAVSVGLLMDRDNPDLFVVMNVSEHRGCSMLIATEDEDFNAVVSTPELGRFVGQPRQTHYPLNRDRVSRYRRGDGNGIAEKARMAVSVDEREFIDEAVFQFSLRSGKIKPLKG